MNLPELKFEESVGLPELDFGEEEPTPEPIEEEGKLLRAAKAGYKTYPRMAYGLSKSVNEALALGTGLVSQAERAIGDVIGTDESGIFSSARDWLQKSADEQAKILSGEKDIQTPFGGINIGKSEAIRDKKLIEDFSLLIDPEYMITQTSDAATSLVPMIAAAYATGGGSLIPAATGALQEAGSFYNNIRKDEDVTETEALTSTLGYGVVSGALQKIGLDKILAKTPVKNLATKFAVSAAKGSVEAATEYAEELASAAIETVTKEGITDPEIGRKIVDAVKDAARNIDVMVGAFITGTGVSATQTQVEEKSKETGIEELPELKFEDIEPVVGEDALPDLQPYLDELTQYEQGEVVDPYTEKPIEETTETETPTKEGYFAESEQPITEQDYIENRKIEKDQIATAQTNAKRVAGEITKGVDKYLGAISTRLGNINPKIKSKMRKLGYDTDTKSAQDVLKFEPLMAKAKSSMSKDDTVDWDYARKNSDKETINRLVSKYGLEEEYGAYRNALDNLREEALDVGLDVSYIEEYAPRVIKDTKGFLNETKQMNDWPVISRRLEAAANNMGMKVAELTDDQKADIISNMFVTGRYGLSGVKATKERKLQKIPANLNKYYMDSDAALMQYVYSMRKAIEARKFFGKVPDKIAIAKRRLNVANKRLVQLKKADALDNEQIADIQDNMREYQAIINKYKNQRDYSENISSYVMDLMAKGEIDATDEQDLIEILAARFNEKGTRGVVQAYKNLSYIDTMGSITSALTQLGDLAWAAYDSGLVPTLKHAAKAVAKKSQITKEDVGIERIAQEFQDAGTLGKAVSNVFKLVGLEKIDSIGKETLLNSSLEKYKKQAKSNPAKLKNQIKNIFEGETDKVIQDLQNGDITDNVKLLVYNRLLDFQPVALSEMPQKYLDAGNGRIFYMLKTFTLKQFDVYRNEVFKQLKSKDKATKLQGMKNFVRLSAMFAMANAGADELKDFVLGRETNFKDRTVDNLLRLAGVSKFVTWKARTEGVGSAMARQVLPPFKFIDALTKDIITMGDEKGLETLASVPIIGKLAYWHMGKGVLKSGGRIQKQFAKERRRLKKIGGAKYRRINAVQNRLNTYTKRINKLKKLPESKNNKKRIMALEKQKDKLMSDYLEGE